MLRVCRYVRFYKSFDQVELINFVPKAMHLIWIWRVVERMIARRNKLISILTEIDKCEVGEGTWM